MAQGIVAEAAEQIRIEIFLVELHTVEAVVVDAVRKVQDILVSGAVAAGLADVKIHMEKAFDERERAQQHAERGLCQAPAAV